MSDQETFISHLIELRSRLVRAVAVVLAIFVVLFIWPGSGRIYDALALPLMRALPEGATMIAIGVITPFMVPVRSEEHTSELQSRLHLVCRLLLEKKKTKY